MRKKNSKDRNNIFLVVIFGFCVLFLIIVSLSIKFAGVVSDSKYSSGRFTVLLIDNTGEAVYISVDENEKTASKLVVKQTKSFPDLPVGVDGVIELSSDVESEKSSAALVSEMLIKRNEERLHVTFLDLIRMYFALKTTPSEDITILIAENEQDVPVIRLRELFEDVRVVREDKTVAIENASQIPGVATKLELVLTAMGANVISVETSVVPQAASKIIYYGDRSYTSDKIQSYLTYPVEESQTQQIADISIIIGEDGFQNVIFPEKKL